ncbi:unknown [Ruminococcus sp. CAG:382]|nr:unknown [Ruminococcus sp. CAG:382]
MIALKCIFISEYKAAGFPFLVAEHVVYIKLKPVRIKCKCQHITVRCGGAQNKRLRFEIGIYANGNFIVRKSQFKRSFTVRKQSGFSFLQSAIHFFHKISPLYRCSEHNIHAVGRKRGYLPFVKCHN